MTVASPELDATQEDIDAVSRAALDYLFGYVEADPERHARAYHPEAVKRRYGTDDSGVEVLDTLSPQMMVDWAAAGLGRAEDTEYEIMIDDITEGMASVRVYSTRWIDFLHIVEARGEWRILHATWKQQPGGASTNAGMAR